MAFGRRAQSQQVSVTIGNAAIKAGPTSSPTLLAAPGDGFMWLATSGILVATTSAGAYTNIDSFTHAVQVGTGAFGQLVGGWTPDVLGTARIFVCGLMANTIPDGNATPIINIANAASEKADFNNLPLVLILQNTLGNYTGGNAANTLKLTLQVTKYAL